MFECQTLLSRFYRRYLHILVKLKSTQNLIGNLPEGDFKTKAQLENEKGKCFKFKVDPIYFNF